MNQKTSGAGVAEADPEEEEVRTGSNRTTISSKEGEGRLPAEGRAQTS